MLVNRHKLDNGLRIVHHKTERSNNVTINVLYGVGARNETPLKTGLAHMLEHMMFCGSENVENFDAPLERTGGTSNAYTTCDITNYYLTLPKENVETGFWIESDRMLNPKLDAGSFKIQKHVVLEEFKQGLNEPYGDAMQLLKRLCYKKHPYMHNTIGLTLNHVERLGLSDVKSFFKTYYKPSNAVLSVVGNIEWEKVLQLADKWFSNIPSSQNRIRDIEREPIQTARREATRFGAVPQNVIYKAYHICECTHEDYFVCDMISDILANGKSARLPQSLVYGSKLFSAIDAYVDFNIDPGLLIIMGKINDNVDVDRAAEAIDEQTDRLMAEEVLPEEIEKCRNKYELSTMASRFDIEQTAADIALFELIGRPGLENSIIEEYCKTTPQKLKQVASEIFRHENCSTLFYMKK